MPPPKLTSEYLGTLIRMEANVHYGEPPPPGRDPFIVVERSSPILLSAPHGARTFRNNDREIWHEEDEYTAAMALFLAEHCRVSAIATIYRTNDSDPNHHEEPHSPYKRAVRELVASQKVRWLIDLHGAGEHSGKLNGRLVDLGTRNEKLSLPTPQRDELTRLIEERLGKDTVNHNGFAAIGSGTMTAFAQAQLDICSVQIEMKPSVRVPSRRVDASAYATTGAFAADPERVTAMMQALADYIAYLKTL